MIGPVVIDPAGDLQTVRLAEACTLFGLDPTRRSAPSPAARAKHARREETVAAFIDWLEARHRVGPDRARAIGAALRALLIEHTETALLGIETDELPNWSEYVRTSKFRAKHGREAHRRFRQWREGAA